MPKIKTKIERIAKPNIYCVYVIKLEKHNASKEEKFYEFMNNHYQSIFAHENKKISLDEYKRIIIHKDWSYLPVKILTYKEWDFENQRYTETIIKIS